MVARNSIHLQKGISLHVQCYFDEFQWHFKRRVNLPSMLGRVARAVSSAAPRHRHTLKLAAYEALGN